MNKQQAIKYVHEQLSKHETYIFKDLLQKLVDAALDQNHQLAKILSILITQTYKTLTEKKIKLDQKYIKKLRILSILTCFYGQERYSLSQLQKELICSRQVCLNLLMEASISKLIVVKIEESRGIIVIERSKVRERETAIDIDRVINSKIIQIQQKNSKLELNLKEVLSSIGGRSQPIEKQEESIFSTNFRKRMDDLDY